MKVRDWKFIKRQEHANCKVFTVAKNTFEHPDGRRGDFYINESGDWVQCAALVRDEQDGILKTVLVNQFRFGSRKTSWEFSGGIVEPNESPVTAAVRELSEETGYTGTNPTLIAQYSPNPAIQNNSAFFVIIENCKKTDKLNWDENEEIQTKLVPISELDAMIERGEIYHSIAINSVYFLKRYLEKKGEKY